jgi:hypothetical protein
LGIYIILEDILISPGVHLELIQANLDCLTDSACTRAAWQQVGENILLGVSIAVIDTVVMVLHDKDEKDREELKDKVGDM